MRQDAAAYPAGMNTDSGAAAIPPDDKDWTWVLERPCPECGFDAARIPVGTVAGRLLAATPRWHEALSRADARERPAPTTWSPLEYGAHVRDVHRVFEQRARLTQEQHDPLFATWDQDAAAVQDRYDLQDPATVAAELDAAARSAAAVFASVPDDEWDLPARRSDGSTFTLRTLALYYLHDVEHHLHDVRA